jgi:hypothetical protein
MTEILPFKDCFEGYVKWWVWLYWRVAQDVGGREGAKQRIDISKNLDILGAWN